MELGFLSFWPFDFLIFVILWFLGVWTLVINMGRYTEKKVLFNLNTFF